MFYAILTGLLHRFSLVAFCAMLSALPALADVSDDDDDDYDPLPGRTDEQIEALIFNFDEVVETVILYTALFALLVMLFLLAGSMRLRRWMGYTVLSAFSLAWFAFVEQHATGLYWIGLNPPLSVLTILGAPLISAHFIVAGWYMPRVGWQAPLRPVVMAMAAAPLVAMAFAWPLTDIRIPVALIVLAVLAVACHLLGLPGRPAGEERTLYTRRNGIVVAAALAVAGFVIFGELDEGFDTSFAVRSLFVLVVLLFAFFLVQSVIGILRERDASQRNALDIARREAAQARALLEAEKKYARAKEAARLHTLRLANASHDIRQPITSLRATMAAVAKDQSDDVKTQLKSAFDYLDQLARSYMETEAPPNARPGESQEVETFSTAMLCSTLDRMFRAEAEAKGLSFEVDAADSELRAPPLVITRILSNLLSNAIQHTASGHVSLSAQPSDNGYRFAVHNSAYMEHDAGAEALFEHGTTGNASTGAGYGLAIIRQLAEKAGLALGWRSDRADGTEFTLAVPAKAVA